MSNHTSTTRDGSRKQPVFIVLNLLVVAALVALQITLYPLALRADLNPRSTDIALRLVGTP